MTGRVPSGLVVISREGCGLCEEMLHALADLEGACAPLPLQPPPG